MSGSRKHTSYPSEGGLEPYHDDPTMGSAADATRSPALSSPGDGHDSERPPLLSIRSSVPLMPTPGSVSQRHPTYVGSSSLCSCTMDVDPLSQEPLVLRFWFVAVGCVFLGALGVGLEVARVISRDNGGVSSSLSSLSRVIVLMIRITIQGFYVPQKNVFSFASIQFLTVSARNPPPVWALLTVRAIQVVLPLSALRSARDHDQGLRWGYPIVECTQNHAF